MSRLALALFFLTFHLGGASAQVGLPFPGPGMSASSGSGCAQATTYLARTTGGNEGGNAANITTVICNLVAHGVITGNLSTTGCGAPLDFLYILAQQNTADASLNICGTNYTLTLNGATFTTYQGYIASTPGLDTGFNPTTATSPNFTQNSASFGVWAYATLSESNAQMSQSTSGGAVASQIFDHFTDGKFYARTNETTGAGVSGTFVEGLFTGDRSSSSAEAAYWDGNSVNTPNVTSVPPVNGDFYIGAFPGASASGEKLSGAFGGGALGSTLELSLYNDLRTYMTAVGVP